MKKIPDKKHRFIRLPDKLSHILIAVIACLILVYIVEWDASFFDAEFHVGDVVLKSTYAPFDFKIKGDIDYNATEAARKNAADSIAPVYLIDSSVKESLLNKVDSFSNSLQSLKQDAATEDRLSKIKEAITPYDIPLPVASSILGLKDPKDFFAETAKIVEYVTDAGVIPASELARLNKGLVKTITLIDKVKNTEQAKSIDDIWSFSDIRKKTDSLLAPIKDRKEKTLLTDFISVILIPNLKYQEAETDFRKQTAASKIKPVYSVLEIKKNELIINKGERISKEDMLKLRQFSSANLIL